MFAGAAAITDNTWRHTEFLRCRQVAAESALRRSNVQSSWDFQISRESVRNKRHL